MAKSIYDILVDLETTTSVPGHGKEIAHTIPRELLPTATQFENESSLLNWAESTGNLHAVLQKGIQKFIIDLRAAFKGCKKSDTWSPEYGQNNVDAMTWKVTNRPNQVGNKKALLEAKLEAGIEMAKAMKATNIDDSIIISSLTTVYGKDGAEAILAALA